MKVEGTSKMEKNYQYLINLNKFRIALLTTAFFSLLSIFFFLGFIIGSFSTSEKNINSESNYLTREQQKFYQINQENNFTSPKEINREAILEGQQIVSSTALLEIDGVNDKGSSKNNSQKTIQKRIIKVPATTRIASKNYIPKYYIQVLVSGDIKKVEYFKKELLNRKYKAYMRSFKNKNNQTVYSLRVGLYQDKKKIEKDLEILRSKGGFTNAFIKLNKPLRS